LSYFYNLPFGKGQSWCRPGSWPGCSGLALGGIFTARAALPSRHDQCPESGVSICGKPAESHRRPDTIHVGSVGRLCAIQAGRKLSVPNLSSILVFSSSGAGTLGNVGRNTLIAPAVVSLDLSVQRESFWIREDG